MLCLAAFIAGGVMMVSTVFRIGRLSSYGIILAELPVTLEGSESERVLRIAGRSLPEAERAVIGPVAMVLQLDLRSSDMPFGRSKRGSGFNLAFRCLGECRGVEETRWPVIVGRSFSPKSKNYEYGTGGDRVIFTGEDDGVEGRFTRVTFRLFQVNRTFPINETVISIGRDREFDTRVVRAGAYLFSPEPGRSEGGFSRTVAGGFGLAALGIVLLFAGILTRKPRQGAR